MRRRIEIPKRTPRGEKIMLARYKKKNPAYVEAEQLRLRIEMEKRRWHVFINKEGEKEIQMSLTIELPEK